MKVYITSKLSHSGFEVQTIGIFSTQELAKACIHRDMTTRGLAHKNYRWDKVFQTYVDRDDEPAYHIHKVDLDKDL